MSEDNGVAAVENDAQADAAFLQENVDLKYLKKVIDIDLVNSLLGQFAPTPTPAAPPAAHEPGAAEILEPKEEKSILSRIKSLWSGTDKKIKDTDTKITKLNSLLKKAKEVQKLKAEYEKSISRKLGK